MKNKLLIGLVKQECAEYADAVKLAEDLKAEIESIDEELKAYPRLAEAEGTRAVGTPKGPEDRWIYILCRKEKVVKRLEDCERKIASFEHSLSRLEENEERLIRELWCEGVSGDALALDWGCSRASIYRESFRVLKKLAGIRWGANIS